MAPGRRMAKPYNERKGVPLMRNNTFTDAMEIERSVTLRLAGLSEEELTATQKAALDAYMHAYQDAYLAKFGEAGPRGASLRMETEAEMQTRLAWEAAITPEQEERE